MASNQLCAVKYCLSKRYKMKESFFRFPKDPERAGVWAVAAGREDLKNKANLFNSHRICSLHFENKFITNDGVRIKLLSTAIPTIFPSLEGSSSFVDHTYSVVGNLSTSKADDDKENVSPSKINILSNIVMTPDNIHVSQSEEAPRSASSIPPTSFFTPKSHKMVQTSQKTLKSTTEEEQRKKIKDLRNDKNRLCKRIDELENQLAEERRNNIDSISLDDYQLLTQKFCTTQQQADFINTQVSLAKKNPKGRRYTPEFKTECLQMYFTGPKLYRNILMRLFHLPSPSTLLKYIQAIKIKPGLNDKVLKMISNKTKNFASKDKLVIISFDEMALKTHLLYNRGSDNIVGFEDFGDGKKSFLPATQATVLMVRGLHNKWKQPLGYYVHSSACTSEKLKDILIEAIKALTNCGLTVCAVVSDLGPNNWKLSKMLNITPDTPYFLVDEIKVLYIFDVPHLIKLLRNNLLINYFKYKGKVTSWEHILNFFLHDQKYSIRAAPKLTEAHINPNAFQKMKVKLATQVLSSTVAAGFNTYLRFNFLPASALGTAEVIQMFDNLFDIFNSHSISSTKKFNLPFKNLEYQEQYLEECDNFFRDVKIFNKQDVDITKKIKCLLGWRISINSLKLLWEKVEGEGYDYLLTKRLNQDCLENLFGSIRQQCGNSLNPTTFQFQMSFRKLLCVDLINSGAENCQGDSDNMLLGNTDLFNVIIDDNTSDKPQLEKINIDYTEIDILQQNTTRYVCGYYIKKCLKQHTCADCETFGKKIDILDDSSIYCYFRAYENKNKDTFGSLQMPDDSFVNFIFHLESLFDKNFENLAIGENVVKNFINLIKKAPFNFNHPCKYFPHDYLLALYSRVRFYYTIKFTNLNFRTQKNVNNKSKKNKLVIWRNQ